MSINIENSRKTTRRGAGPGGLFATWTKLARGQHRSHHLEGARNTIVANKPSERIPIKAATSLPYKLPLGVSVLPQPKRQCDEDHAHDHGISADDPDERERTGTRGQHHTDPEQHRDDATQDQEPLVIDLLT